MTGGIKGSLCAAILTHPAAHALMWTVFYIYYIGSYYVSDNVFCDDSI